MTNEREWMRRELDRAITKRNKLMLDASKITEEYELLQVKREKLQSALDNGDVRKELFGIKYGKDTLKQTWKELVRVRDRITELHDEKKNVRHDWRDQEYAITFLRDRLKMDKEGML